MIRCGGAWTLVGISGLEGDLAARWSGLAGEITIHGGDIEEMDTAGAWLLYRMQQAIEGRGGHAHLAGFAHAHEALIDIVRSHGAVELPQGPRNGLLVRIGMAAWQRWDRALAMLSFVGENAITAGRLIVHPGRIRWRPILYNIQTAGFHALPIAGLLSFLMGLVIAYQGADQLKRYGANVFVADLVGLSMLRELAPLLTAIIVAGRSGSAYAAQIGTMKVTEEIDALRTIGIPPLELLVFPKLLALMIALPLLTVYADFMGILGGMVMAKAQLDVGYGVFLDRLNSAIKLSSYMVGIGKAPVFAAIIAMVGCFQGFQVSGGADSVGRQTTVSVVQAIFLVIVTDALFSVAFSWLKI